MPCDNMENWQEIERKRALADLERRLRERSATLALDPVTRRPKVTGWPQEVRAGYCDGCALRALQQSTDARIRQMAADAIAGRTRQTVGG